MKLRRHQRMTNTYCGPATQRGVALVLIVIGFIIGIGVLLVSGMSRVETALSREQISQNALRQAKEGLLAYAGSWPNKRGTDAAVSSNDVFGQKRGPGFLPCPDRTNSGAAVGGCGNEAGSSPASRLGRLPWRTLGLPDLRDGSGERLWYAVSSKYKTNDPNYDLNPDTGLGTISVRDSAGTVIHDGTNTNLYNADSGGVVAVIIAPGAPIDRWEDAAGTSKTVQDRGCSGGGCDSDGTCSSTTTTPRCMPVNYLEKAPSLPGTEDNADMVDRNDDRTGNGNGFIQGPVKLMDGTVVVNDLIVVITYSEIMAEMMKRVALEVVNCMEAYGLANGNRYPYPAPACRSGYSTTNQWSDREMVLFGRVPDAPFDTTRSDSGSTMQETWNSSTTLGCTLGTDSTKTEWWDAWKNFVFIAVADNHKPGSGTPGTCSASSCLQIVDASGTVTASSKQFAVIVGGRPLSGTPGQLHSGGTPDAARLAASYLEATNSSLENMNNVSTVTECADMAPHSAPCSPLSNCNKVTSSSTSSTFNDVVVYYPR